jgi:signal peptidase I
VVSSEGDKELHVHYLNKKKNMETGMTRNNSNCEKEIDTLNNKIKKFVRSEMFEWITIVLVSLVLVVIIRVFLFGTSTVCGDSMYPTLHNNDYLIIRKIAYTPKRSDVIILKKVNDKKALVKRVIGVPGDKIDIDPQTHKIMLNDKVLEEPYIDGAPTYAFQNSSAMEATEFPINKVAENKYVVFGDNRERSADSRLTMIGFVDRNEILGKVSLRLWPADRIGKI